MPINLGNRIVTIRMENLLFIAVRSIHVIAMLYCIKMCQQYVATIF